MEKIRFITDSASDMNHPREDVTILPLHIRFGDDEYADGVTISHREFYEKLIECDTLPTTSLVSPAVFEDAYEQAVSAGETVIVITISGKLSGTCQSARIAAERIRVNPQKKLSAFSKRRNPRSTPWDFWTPWNT